MSLQGGFQTVLPLTETYDFPLGGKNAIIDVKLSVDISWTVTLKCKLFQMNRLQQVAVFVQF